MPKIKYAVWFHGNENESEGICYSGRQPYVVDDKKLAEQHMQYLKSVTIYNNSFSLCTILIDDMG